MLGTTGDRVKKVEESCQLHLWDLRVF